MLFRSSTEISVPMEITAASFRSCSTSSSSVPEKSWSLAVARSPIWIIALAYCMLSAMILVISGKCQPYHSRTRMAYVLSSLSSSSRSPIACTTMVSTLSGENLSLYRDSECDKPSAIGATSASFKPPMSSFSW